MGGEPTEPPPSPRLEVRAPDGAPYRTFALEAPEVAIGRAADAAGDVVAHLTLPDPAGFVSRVHCLVVAERGQWWVVDNGSRNGTFVRREGREVRVDERARLVHGDTICVVGDVAGGRSPRYWELRFVDPETTRVAAVAAGPSPHGSTLRYSFEEAKLYVDVGGRSDPVPLRPHEHRLVRHMAARNAEAGGAPVLCTYDELIDAVWGATTPEHRHDEVNALVFHLRRKLARFTDEPLIENERTLGYRLLTRV